MKIWFAYSILFHKLGTFSRHDLCVENSSSNLFSLSKFYFWLAFDRSNGIDCERGQIHIRIFNFIKSCRTCVNIFEILIPHFMKVGGLYIYSKTAWLIVPYVLMNFLDIFFVQTQIISDPKWRKLNYFVQMGISKTLTWLVCQKGLTFFKSPWNISSRSAPSGSPSARRFGDFDYFLVVLHPIFLCIPCLLKGSRATKKDLVFGLAISAFRLSTVGRP